MPNITMDKLPVGTLDDLDTFRNERFNYLYICKNCTRSFDTVSEVMQCKYCNSTDIQVISSKKQAKSAVSYKYHCPACMKDFVARSKIKNCGYCGSQHIHVYQQESIPQRDELRSRLWQMFSKILKTEKTDQESKETIQQDKQENKKQFKMPEIKMPKFFKSSRRDEEELPTK